MRTRGFVFKVLVASACAFALAACGPSQAEIDAADIQARRAAEKEAAAKIIERNEAADKIAAVAEEKIQPYLSDGWNSYLTGVPRRANVLVRWLDSDSPYWQTCEESSCWNLEVMAVVGCYQLEVEMQFYAGDGEDEGSWVLLDTASDSVASLDPEVRTVMKFGTGADGAGFAKLSSITCD